MVSIYPISFCLKVENNTNDGFPTAHESFQMSVCLSDPLLQDLKKETCVVVFKRKDKSHPRQTGASINIQM